MKIATIIGARPQFIKASAVSHAISSLSLPDASSLASSRGVPSSASLRGASSLASLRGAKRRSNLIKEIIIHTGQHYDYQMSKVFFDQLDIPKPHYNLEVGSGTHAFQTGTMLIKIEKVLQKEKPDMVLVYGDTNSTLAGALAAAKLQIPVAHIEAGMRSFNRQMPEETNRVLTDHIAALHFCATQTAVNNLKKEGIKEGIHLVGDVMYDVASKSIAMAKKRSPVLTKHKLKPKSYYLATVHRQSNTDNLNNLKNILEAFAQLDKPVVFPVHPRTKKVISDFTCYPTNRHSETLHHNCHSEAPSTTSRHSETLHHNCHSEAPSTTSRHSEAPKGPKNLNNSNILFIDPVSYLDMLLLEKNAHKILTDSGGVQKEAYFFKVPCITLREETEWLETLNGNRNILAGTDPKHIIRAVRTKVNNSNTNNFFGTGNAAKKICNILLRHCEGRTK